MRTPILLLCLFVISLVGCFVEGAPAPFQRSERKGNDLWPIGVWDVISEGNSRPLKGHMTVTFNKDKSYREVWNYNYIYKGQWYRNSDLVYVRLITCHRRENDELILQNTYYDSTYEIRFKMYTSETNKITWVGRNWEFARR